MTQGNPAEKLWLRDERGDLYVLTPDLLDAIRVPAEHRAQAETIIGGGGADAGFIGIHALASQGRATSAPLSFTVAGATLTLVGVCTCDCHVGVADEGYRVTGLVADYRDAARLSPPGSRARA
jgi:hypothetical protein